jgi:hypothetical protein
MATGGMRMFAIVLGIAIVAVASCGGPNRIKDDGMNVEIDVYSGRPNPELRLAAADQRELMLKLRDLPKSADTMPEAGLGYRGFVVTIKPDAPAAEAARATESDPERTSGKRQVFRIFAGLVVAEDGGDSTAFTDARGAEEWLKKQADAAGFSALVR